MSSVLRSKEPRFFNCVKNHARDAASISRKIMDRSKVNEVLILSSVKCQRSWHGFRPNSWRHLSGIVVRIDAELGRNLVQHACQHHTITVLNDQLRQDSSTLMVPQCKTSTTYFVLEPCFQQKLKTQELQKQSFIYISAEPPTSQ